MYDIINTVSVLRAPTLYGHLTPIGIYASRYLAAFSISAALTESGNFINAVAAEKPVVDLLYDGEVSYSKWKGEWKNENSERTAVFGSNPKTYYGDAFASPLLWFMTPGMKFPASETVPQELEVDNREGKRFPPPGFLPGLGFITGNTSELNWKKPKLGISLLEPGRQRKVQEIFAGTANAGVAEDEKALMGWLENALRGKNEGEGMDFTYRKMWKHHGSPKDIDGSPMQQILNKEPPTMISKGPLEDGYGMAGHDVKEGDDAWEIDDSWESDPDLQLALSWLHGSRIADRKPSPSSVPGFGTKAASSTFTPRFRPAPDPKSASLRVKPLATPVASVWGLSTNKETSAFKPAPESVWSSPTEKAPSMFTPKSQSNPETNTVSSEPKPSATPTSSRTWKPYKKQATSAFTPRFASAPGFKSESSNSKSPTEATFKPAASPQKPRGGIPAMFTANLGSGSNKSASSKVNTPSRMAFGMRGARSVAPSKPAMPAAPSAPRSSISDFQRKGF